MFTVDYLNKKVTLNTEMTVEELIQKLRPMFYDYPFLPVETWNSDDQQTTFICEHDLWTVTDPEKVTNGTWVEWKHHG